MARRWWCGDDGIASFARIRYRRHDASAFRYAFDLIELNGDDLRREALAARKATLASLLALASSGLRFNEHMAHDDGLVVFAQPASSGWMVSSRSGEISLTAPGGARHG